MSNFINKCKEAYKARILPVWAKIKSFVHTYREIGCHYYQKHLARFCNPIFKPLLRPFRPFITKYQAMSSRAKKVVGVGVLLGVIVLIIKSFTGETPLPRKSPSVEIGGVRVAALREKATVIGNLTANQSVVLRAQVAGQITAIHFKGGQAVDKDQPLIQLDDRTYAASLKEAEAQLKTAQAEYERMNKLTSNNNAFAPLKAKEQAEAKLKQAEANYELRKFQMDNTIIRAPFEGIVGLKDENLSVGTVIDQRQDLVSIVDVDPIRVKFSVPSHIALKMQLGQKVNIQVGSLGARTFPAEIDSIDARVNPGTNTLTMQAVADNPHGILKPGLFGRVYIEAGTKDNALVVPEVAVDMLAEESYVYRVVALKTRTKEIVTLAVKTQVTRGLRDNAAIEIASGLKEGDLVITTGHMKLGGIDRAVVRVVNEEEYPELLGNIVDVSKPKAAEVPPPPTDEQTTEHKKEKKLKKKSKKKPVTDDEDDWDDPEDEEIEDIPLLTHQQIHQRKGVKAPAKPSALDRLLAPTEESSADKKANGDDEKAPREKEEKGEQSEQVNKKEDKEKDLHKKQKSETPSKEDTTSVSSTENKPEAEASEAPSVGEDAQGVQA